jgi:hypothetical protein
VKREKLPTNTMLGFKEAFEDGAEGSGLPGKNIAQPLHKRSDSE